MPRFDQHGCRIVGAVADSLELAQCPNTDQQLDELRVAYDRKWGFTSTPANDTRTCWVGVYHANGRLVAAIGYIYSERAQEIWISDILSDDTRWGKVGTYLLFNWIQRTTRKGTKIFGKCIAENTQHRKCLEQFGGKVVTVLYFKEV